MDVFFWFIECCSGKNYDEPTYELLDDFQNSLLFEIPDEVLIEILSYLEQESILCNLPKVSRYFYNICHQNITLKRFAEERCHVEKLDPMKMFIENKRQWYRVLKRLKKDEDKTLKSVIKMHKSKEGKRGIKEAIIDVRISKRKIFTIKIYGLAAITAEQYYKAVQENFLKDEDVKLSVDIVCGCCITQDELDYCRAYNEVSYFYLSKVVGIEKVSVFNFCL